MAKKVSWFESMRASLLGLWDDSHFRLDREPSRFLKFLHFWILVWRSFGRNRGPARAAALSYTTLLALIPMLAVALSISSIFLKSKGEQQIEEFIQQLVNRVIPPVDISTNVVTVATEGPPTAVGENDTRAAASNSNLTTPLTNHLETTNAVVLVPPSTAGGTNSVSIKDTRVMAAQKEVAEYIHHFIQNTYSGTLGATGMLLLFVTSILTLTGIEEAFNDIWGVSRGRDWLTRVVYYLAAIVFGPALLFCALGLASGPHFQKTRDLLAGLPLMNFMFSQFVPVVVICISFTLFYKLMPNTKVRWTAALVGGALAGTCWHIYNLLGFLLISRAVTASKIYGSVALVVLFMGGLYVIWYTVLFGAQIAYAFQNRDTYLQEKLAENVNQRGREFVALRLMTCIGQRFQRGLPLATVSEMSKELGVPSKLVQQVLHNLLSARLVVEVAREEPAYSPARPLENINAHHVLMAMRATPGQELMARDEPVRAEVYGEFARIQEAEKQVASSISLMTLVNRAQATLELAPPQDPNEELKLTHALVPPSAKTTAPTPQESSEPQSAPVGKPEPQKTPHIIEPLTDEERDFPL